MSNTSDIQSYEHYFRNPQSPNDILIPSMSGENCANIRQALRLLKYRVEDNDRYDDELQVAVLQFQKDYRHTSRDGLFGPGTRRLLIQTLLEEFGPTIFKRVFTEPQVQQGHVLSLFISYKREDMPRIEPLLEQLRASGCDCWYDADIPGSAHWLEMIEANIQRRDVVVVFLSQAAVESEWVRRELMYADSLHKPILPIALERVQLKYGLGILLNPSQMLNISDDNFSTRLMQAIDYIRREG